MKKITVVVFLLASLAMAGQSKKDLSRRNKDVFELAQKTAIKNNLKNAQTGYVTVKLAALEPALKLNEKPDREYINKLIGFFYEQYPATQEAWNKYHASESTATKLELFKVMVKNEEDFRKLLTQEHLLAYLRYGDKNFSSYLFDDNFMNDETLAKYKKEIE